MKLQKWSTFYSLPQRRNFKAMSFLTVSKFIEYKKWLKQKKAWKENYVINV